MGAPRRLIILLSALRRSTLIFHTSFTRTMNAYVNLGARRAPGSRMREREPQDDSGRGDLAGGARVACVCAGDDSHDWAAAGHGLEYRKAVPGVLQLGKDLRKTRHRTRDSHSGECVWAGYLCKIGVCVCATLETRLGSGALPTVVPSVSPSSWRPPCRRASWPRSLRRRGRARARTD